MDHLPVPGIPAGPSRTCRLYPAACRRLTAPGEIASRVGLILTWEVTRRCQGDGLWGGPPCSPPSTSATAAGSSGAWPGLLDDKYVWSLQVTGYPVTWRYVCNYLLKQV